MKAHFFDIDSILTLDNKVWVVDKTNPNTPLLKISQSDFNLIKSGIWKNKGNEIRFSGESYFLPDDLMNSIKIKAKGAKSNVSNLAFSMQEFLNPEIISNLNFEINWGVLMGIKNTDDDIYIICSKNSKKNYEEIISKIEDGLKKEGLIVKNWYFISETFYNRNEDEVGFKKVRLILQHLLGLKTDERKFTKAQIENYHEINFYDVDGKSIEDMKKANDFLHVLLSNTDKEIQDEIRTNLKTQEHILQVVKVNENKLNKFQKTKVILSTSNLIKTFESFRFK